MSDGDEFLELSDEAKADAAPIAAEMSYVSRRAWKPGICAGYIINWSRPVARIKWPKKREGRDFIARVTR